jgi:transposase
MSKEPRARKPYPSDLADAQWTTLEQLIPAAHTQRGERPREVVNTPLYLNRSGWQ